MFPLVRLLGSEACQQKSLGVCGHSLGGAISAIVTTEILIEMENRKRVNNEKFVKDVVNITFGSPLFGDETVRRYLDESGVHLPPICRESIEEFFAHGPSFDSALEKHVKVPVA